MVQGLNSAWLKIIALITMTIDHIGLILFPEQLIYRYIGRIAFPIFAYLIAEGYIYTRDKRKYFLKMLVMAILTQIPYVVVQGNWYLNIFFTFVVSIAIMIFIDFISSKIKSNENNIMIGLALTALIYFIGNTIFSTLTFKSVGIELDYGMLGAIVPVLVYLGRNKTEKLIYFFLGLLAVALAGHTHVQIYSLISVLLMMLYNGERGYNARWFKELFWFYYPIHLGVLYLINLI